MPLLKFIRRSILALGAGGCVLAALAAGTPVRGSFHFVSGGHDLKVWYYEPAAATADAPVLFVIHGVGRNAEEYLDDWIPQAEKQRCVLVVPEFSKAQFPGEAAFNSGNLFDRQGRLLPKAQWSFSLIEPVFDLIRTRLGNRRSDYLLYGHSAGAQFVHRFLYYVPEARVARAVAANAGWYMMPDFSAAFPYGLKGAPTDAAALRTAFARPLVVLLGEGDTDVHHPALRHTPEADAQGPYRLARGRYFFAHAQAAAAAMVAPFHWRLALVPGVAHSNRDMAPFAVPLLFPH